MKISINLLAPIYVASKVLSYHATAPLEEANKLKVCNHKIKILENSWYAVDCYSEGMHPDKVQVKNFI